ncbi:MAG: MBL fold metallo-hydrolase [Sphingomonas sp.]
MLNSLIAIGVLAAAGGLGTPPRIVATDPWCRAVSTAGVALDLAGMRFAPEQAGDPSTPIAAIDARQSILLLPGRTFLLRTSTIYPGNIEFRFRTIGDPDSEKTIDELGWRDGDALLVDDGASSTKDYADLQMLAPSVLRCGAAGRGTAADGGIYMVQDAAQRRVALKTDQAGRIVEASVGNEKYLYSGWGTMNGLPFPARIQRERAGQVVARWQNARVRAARAQDRAWLAIPSRYRVADPTGELRATSLGEGAYRVDGAKSGYHTGFVVGSRAIAMFDAPAGTEEAKAVRALIEKTAPGRKVTYVVVSHVHGDHVAGLPAYPDADIITGRGGSAALMRQFPNLDPARIREIPGDTVLDLGGRTVRLFALDSAHSSTMLVGYDLATRAIFQGDLFYLPERGPMPAAFPTAVELSRLIAGRGLDVDWIVGVHGRTATAGDLKAALSTPLRLASDRGRVGDLVDPR